MTRIFHDDLHDDFAACPLAFIPYGGADFGEVLAVAQAVGDGDDDAYFDAWNAAGDRISGEAQAAFDGGHSASARALHLKASAFYASSLHPLYGSPADPRLLAAYGKQRAAFDKALAMGAFPVQPLSIPSQNTSLPAYFIPAEGHEKAVRPLIIFNNGYDSTITDFYFAGAVAASRRGYHSLLFDGPGQGAMLYEQNVPLRPDWEAVIGKVVDFALGLPLVDARRVALYGWSLGGYLAPRGASAEPRLAALIADPGTWSIADGFRRVIIGKLGVPAEAASDLGQLDQAILDKVDAIIRADRAMNWKVVKRGFWVHGVDDLRAYFASTEQFTMNGRAERIACPTLITQAENDPLGADANAFYDRLTCRKTLMRFKAVDGAGGHCELGNRSLANGRVLDWLDEVLG